MKYYTIPKSKCDIRDYSIIASTADFPKTFSVDTIVPIKNQGSKPTCVAHALSSTVEYHHQRQHGSYAKFSTEFIYGVRDVGYYIGHGMSVREGLITLTKYGDVYEEDCKGNHDYKQAIANVSKDFDHLKELAYPHRISGYFKIKNANALKTALMNHGVVVVCMKVYDNHKLVNDVYTYNDTNDYGYHCVFIYGWNEQGWLVQNSWGKLYGGDGRFVIPFNFKFDEIWGVTDDITDLDILKPKRNKILDIIYKFINKIINLFKK